jgi:hypothetical protein
MQGNSFDHLNQNFHEKRWQDAGEALVQELVNELASSEIVRQHGIEILGAAYRRHPNIEGNFYFSVARKIGETEERLFVVGLHSASTDGFRVTVARWYEGRFVDKHYGSRASFGDQGGLYYLLDHRTGEQDGTIEDFKRVVRGEMNFELRHLIAP